MTKTTYIRTRNGKRVHLAECTRVALGHSTPWEWAEGKDKATIREWAAKLGILTCSFCKPLEEKEGREKP